MGRRRREKGRREEKRGGELGRRLGEAWEERWGGRIVRSRGRGDPGESQDENPFLAKGVA